MIRFFRRIRKNLLEENRLRKYIVYAIGEIILVMIGILLALQVNNWNEEKKGKAELNQYLGSLKENIQQDIKTLDSLTERREVALAACKKERLNFLNKTYSFSDTRQALKAYLDFYFVPNTSAYDALKNSSYLGKINGTDLNDLTTDYYAKTAQIAETEKSYNEFIETLEADMAYDIDRSLMMAYVFMKPEELQATKTTQEEINAFFKDLHNTVAFRNIVSQYAISDTTIILFYKEAIEIGLNIISEIDKMIKN